MRSFIPNWKYLVRSMIYPRLNLVSKTHARYTSQTGKFSIPRNTNKAKGEDDNHLKSNSMVLQWELYNIMVTCDVGKKGGVG